jgi:hypothetical protein
MEKITVAQLVKKFLAFREVPRFITVFARACQGVVPTYMA